MARVFGQIYGFRVCLSAARPLSRRRVTSCFSSISQRVGSSAFWPKRMIGADDLVIPSVSTPPPCDPKPTAHSILRIPEAVRGLTTLDKELFVQSAVLPVVVVNARDVPRIRGCTEKQSIKNLLKIKPIMDVDNEPGKKMVILNPNVLLDDESRSTLLRAIRNAAGDDSITFVNKEFMLSFDSWDARSIFKAILPDGIDYSAFTQTGHIIHCNFRDDLLPFRHIIGEVLLNKVHNCRTVVYKPDVVKNVFRNLEVELIAGEPDYVTEALEDGIRYKMDFTKVFWNSRLSHEHARVLKNIDTKSIVCDACAGIGPFVLPAAKKRQAMRIYANDLNPDSVRYMHENIKLNKIPSDRIEVHNEDAIVFLRTVVAPALCDSIRKCQEGQDPPSGVHILMNLPALAVTFLPAFRGLLYTADFTPPATDLFPIVVYCYMFVKAHEEVMDCWYSKKAREMALEQLGDDSIHIRNAHEVRTVSNRKLMFCVECVLPWRFLFAKRDDACVNARETPAADHEEPDVKRPRIDE